MIQTLLDNSGWLYSLLIAIPYLGRLSMLASVFGMLGPFGAVLQYGLEKLALALSMLAMFALKVAAFCLFNPITWAAITFAYFAGSFYPVQNIDVKVKLNKRPPAVHATSSGKPAKRRADTRNETMRNFQR